MRIAEKGSAVVTKPIINIFGVPEIRIGSERVHSAAALDLLAVLVLLRHDPNAGTDILLQVLGKEKVNPDHLTGEPESALRKRKSDLKKKFGLELPKSLKPCTLGPLIVEQADVDVAEFEAKIASPDSQAVRQAVALRRRGPLLSGWPQSKFVEEVRRSRDKLYQAALWRLIQEDRSQNLQEAVQWIDLLLDCPDLPQQSRDVLSEDRLALRHDIFRAKPTTGSKTTQQWRPPPLPSPLTALVGREAEVSAIQDLLFAHRLVTLEGTGGIGKTRLALAVAQGLQERFSGGAAFADFSAVSDAAQLSQQTGLCLGLEREEDRKPAPLAGFLQDKSLLLVWDNCEHLVEACAALAADILTRCPAVRILSTSREMLGAYGEACYPVPALPETDALALFAARAKLVRFDFHLTPQNSAAVSEICRDLDGLPLAVELAASLMKTQTPQQVLSKLGQRFDLLSDGPHSAPTRHRSLRAAFDVSYALLEPDAQTLFRRLGAFTGSFSTEAAAAVSQLLPANVSALLDRLVRRCLVVAEPSGEEVRYRLLATIKQYAEEQMQGQEEWEETHCRHRMYFLSLAEAAYPHYMGPDQYQWLDRLESVHDDLRAALASYRESGREEEGGLRLAARLWPFWWVRGYLNEGRAYLQEALAAASDASTSSYALALEGAGNLAYHLGDYPAAAAQLDQGLALMRDLNDEKGIARVLVSSGGLSFGLQKAAKAQAQFQEALLLFRRLNDTRCIPVALVNLGAITLQQQDYVQARLALDEALAMFRALKDERNVIQSLYCLGNLEHEEGNFQQSETLLKECLLLSAASKDKWKTILHIESLVPPAVAQGHFRRSGRLWGCAEALREAFRSPMPAGILVQYQTILAQPQEKLGEAAYTAALAEGRAMTWEQAVSHALEEAEVNPNGA